jgi:hypothetical protein
MDSQKVPSQVKQVATGAEAIKVQFNDDGDWWTARLTSSHSALMEFLCTQSAAGNLMGCVAWHSERGTFYGRVGTKAVEGSLKPPE